MPKDKTPRTPTEVIKNLATSYKSWKSSEKKKEKFRKEFFGSITSWVKDNEEQAEKLVTVVADNEDDARALAEKENPFWLVDEIREDPEAEGQYEVIISENPEYQEFTIEYKGETWGRQIVSGSSLLDNELLQEEDPDLWRRITVWPGADMLAKFAIDYCGIKPSDFDEIMEQYAEDSNLSRAMKPLDALEPVDSAQVQKYMYEGKPSIRLPAPKKVDG